MSPLVAGAALTLCYAVGVVGWVFVRAPGAAARRLEPPLIVEERRQRSVTARVLGRASDRLAGWVLPALSRRRRELTAHRIQAAGDTATLEAHVGRKAVYAVVLGGLGVSLLTVTPNPLPLVALLYLGWVLPDLMLAGRVRRRQATIDRDLPDFLDILAVVVAAGLGFRAALARVGDAVGGPVSEEIGTALREMDLGESRRAAFDRLRSRNDSEALGTFVTALLQAEELGTPLTDVIADIAIDMRREFAQMARRQAAQASPRVSLIVTTVIVPGAILLIITALFVGSEFNLGEVVG